MLLASASWAHPVAQGQIEVHWQDTALRIDVRVSGEQILVASALLPDSTSDSLAGLRREHAHYLLQHLQIQADGQALRGRLLEVVPVEGEFVRFRLSYPVPRIPRQLQLKQDLLNEILYTPGNPWEASFLVRMRDDRGTWRESLLPSKNQPLLLGVASPNPPTRLALQFISQGVHHILTGYDHLLFVCALVLAVSTLRSLFTVILTFTLAHSITLALSALQLVQLPSNVVEPVIAGSIVVVALSNILWPGHGDTRARLAIAFCFGLFHGLGFAGGLLEATEQLTAVSLSLAITGFSLGVELGHMVVVLPLFLLLRVLRKPLAAESGQSRTALATVRVGSAFISLAGAFYLAMALR